MNKNTATTEQPTHITGTDGVEYELTYEPAPIDPIKAEALLAAVTFCKESDTGETECIEVAKKFELYLRS